MENKITLDLIKDLMTEINAHAFNNQLQLDSIKVSLSNRTKALGHVGFKRQIIGLEKVIIATDLKISKNFEWSLDALKNVIAHELIHIFEIQVLKLKPAHSFHFRSQMNRLNSMGYKVEVRSDLQLKLESNKKDLIYILSEDKSRAIFTSLICFNKITASPAFQSKFKNFSTGRIQANKVLSKYSPSRKYRGSYRVDPSSIIELGLN